MGDKITPEARFWQKVEKSANGCWLWLGFINSKGYGTCYWKGTRSKGAHRLSYELLRGPIPDNLTIDHLCRNRKCVNPDHLEAVSIKENVLRGDTIPGRNSRKTHCLHGHEFNQTNTHITKDGHRRCIACAKIGGSSPDRLATQKRYDDAHREQIRLRRRSKYAQRRAERLNAE